MPSLVTRKQMAPEEELNVKETCNDSGLREITKKIQNIHLEDEYEEDQPIDYSCKYLENDRVGSERNTEETTGKVESVSQSETPGRTHVWEPQGNETAFHPFPHKHTQMVVGNSTQDCSFQHMNNVYGGYTETDLDDPDQPTDFSQKYKEHMDTSEDYEAPRSLSEDAKSTAFYDDTLKVYCTEGTPLNFSTASSLLDLREIALTTTDSEANKPEVKRRASVEFVKQGSTGSDQLNSDSTGLNKNVNLEEVKERENKNSVLGKKSPSVDKEVPTVFGKSVTFGEEINYAMETPLMFSRCSSLDSLSSFDQQSIHDDRSSVVSDFSCHASGVVSPSDLPDSPSQTMPPSPHQNKYSPAIFHFPTCKSPIDHLKAKKSKQIIEEGAEDYISHFADEGGNISGATSLSSLTIEGEPKIQKDKSLVKICKSPILEEKEEGYLETSTDALSEEPSCFFSSQGSDDDHNISKQNDTGVLCPSSEGRSNKSFFSQMKMTGSMSKLAQVSSLNSAGTVLVYKMYALQSADTNGDTHRTPSTEGIFADQLKVFQVEGTPTVLSQTGSLSDLSMVSGAHSFRAQSETSSSFCSDHENGRQLPGMSYRMRSFVGKQSNSSSSLCSDSKNLLQQHIQARMRFSKSTTPFSESGSNSSSDNENVLPQLIKEDISIPKSKLAFSKNLSDSDNSICSGDEDILQKCIQAGMHPSGKIPKAFDRYTQDFPTTSVRKPFVQSKTVKTVQLQHHSPAFSSPMDTPRVYAVEGTPLAVSDNNSVSSLSFEEEVTSPESRDKVSEKQRKNEMYGCSSRKFLRTKLLFESHPEHLSFLAEQPFTLTTTDLPSPLERSYNLEDKSGFSRNGSLSPLSIISSSSGEQGLLQERNNFQGSKSRATDLDDETDNTCMSSASKSSYIQHNDVSDDELSPGEEALLKECISFGMSRNKTKHCERRAGHRGASRCLSSHDLYATEKARQIDPESDTEQENELSPGEEALLKECISFVMPKNKHCESRRKGPRSLPSYGVSSAQRGPQTQGQSVQTTF